MCVRAPVLVVHVCVAFNQALLLSCCTQGNGNLEAIKFPLLEHIGENLFIRVSLSITKKRVLAWGH